jgi:hypothetical protein
MGGGYYACAISYSANGIAEYYLIVGPRSTAQASTTLQSKTNLTGDAGARSFYNGYTNTNDTWGDGQHPATQYVKNLSVGGYSDWYVGATAEHQIVYSAFKPTTAANSTGDGSNSYSVPARGHYTAGSPAQTSIASFQTGGSEAFTVSQYWTSTGYSAGNVAHGHDFESGSYFGNAKTAFWPVRAFRKIAV